MATSSTSKISFTVGRVVKFLKLFLANKRGTIGVIILLISSIIALSAPLLTPNDPVKDTYVAGDFAAPTWLSWFYGAESFCPNSQLISNPGFPTMTSLTNEWNFTQTSDYIDVFYEPNNGSDASGPGCAKILFSRPSGKTLAGAVETHLTSKIPYDFHYDSSPKRFTCNMSIRVTGVENLKAVSVIVLMKRLENDTSYILWDEKFSSSENWKAPGIDSYSEAMITRFGGVPTDPAAVVFSQRDQIALTVRVFFEDAKPEMDKKKVEATVFIDDLNLRIYGNTYGLLGTDQQGRDIFSQITYGARISLSVGLLAAFLGVVIGLVVGLAAGYLSTLVDEGLMRFTDILLVLPGLPLLIVLIAVLGPSLMNLIILIGLLGWMGFARVVRSQVLSLKERPYVEAAKAVGAGRFHIITKHILPNVMSLVYVSLALSVPSAILSEAALSFLGLFDPTVVSWGRMLHDAQTIEGGLDKWWWWLPPGLSIALISVAFILLGYALDEILNPRLRRRR